MASRGGKAIVSQPALCTFNAPKFAMQSKSKSTWRRVGTKVRRSIRYATERCAPGLCEVKGLVVRGMLYMTYVLQGVI